MPQRPQRDFPAYLGDNHSLLQEAAQEAIGVAEEQAANDLARIEGIGPKTAYLILLCYFKLFSNIISPVRPGYQSRWLPNIPLGRGRPQGGGG